MREPPERLLGRIRLGRDGDGATEFREAAFSGGKIAEPAEPGRDELAGAPDRKVDGRQDIHDHECMKTITINVSEPVYRDFQRFAKARDRTASELIRDAMEEFRERRILRSTTLADLNPVSVGRVLAPLHVGDDLLEEMLDEHDGA